MKSIETTSGLRVVAVLLVASVFALLQTRQASAQAGLRESLERLDRDQDGEIDPDEITPLARPYLERIARVRRLSLDRSNRIDRLQEAARIYYAEQNGADDDRVRAEPERSIKRFGTYDEDPVVPEFGLPVVKYPYIGDDLDEADSTLRRYDRDGDGYLSRWEARRGRWTHRDPFSMDLNKDEKLSRLELAQRYARRRLLENDSDQLIQRARRVGNGIRSSRRDDDDDDDRRRRSWWRSGGSRFWLTASVLDRFDLNKNDRLEFNETADLGLPTGAIDVDQDGVLTRDELFAYFKDLQDQAAGTMEGLPGWFYELDTNRDGQVSMPEFATELTDKRVNEFVALDRNVDGLLSPDEVLTSKGMTGGRFENTEAEILPPEKTIVSEIEVTEDFLISDLDLQLSITHTNASALDAYLTGPEGTRIELFTGVGGRDDHFENTRFDDEARTPIFKGRPPFEGSFIPEGAAKRQPGLSTFNGKNIRGVWQLTIRCSRSERFGMLHRWAIIAVPNEETLFMESESESSDAESSADGEASEEAAADQASTVGEGGKLPSPMNLAAVSPEQRVQLTAALRKPSNEEWQQMSAEERRRRIEARRQAIRDYQATVNATPAAGGSN